MTTENPHNTPNPYTAKVKPRKELLETLAYCVEVFVETTSGIDSGGAVRAALEADPKVWELLPDDIKANLNPQPK